MNEGKVAVLMGSDSDLAIMNEAAAVFQEFQVPYEIKVLSAHRSPELVREFVLNAPGQGFKVIIAGAGGAAHLAGVAAAHSILPVIGVPIDSTPLQGFDSLLSTVQMPAGIPVAAVAVGKAGAKNAALLAVQMLALSNPDLSQKLVRYKQRLVDGIIEKNKQLQQKLQSPQK